MPRVASFLLAFVLLAVAPAAAQAAAKPFGSLTCLPSQGVRFCEGKVATFDGVPLDLNVTLPATGDGPYPLMILSHGWGGSKLPLAAEDPENVSGGSLPWAKRGYAVLSVTSRGFNGSCGTVPNRLAAGCARGWIRLDDTRYEIRDVQHLAGRLADDGLADPRRIGVHGGSYGGGVSFALAVLRDRIMQPDGSLAPWRSPKGKAMRLAAAAPSIPWSDLVYSLVPNGRTLDYVVPRPEDSRKPAGVEKLSFVSGLFATGAINGFYAPPGADPGADLATWFAQIGAGEPYDGNPAIESLANEIYAHHSSIAIPRTVEPAPTFVASGWTDDLFPADEALRMRNAIAAKYPRAPFSMMFFDFGHQRGTGKEADTKRYRGHVLDWMERYVRGRTTVRPLEGVETLTQTCPSEDATRSGGPFNAPSWKAIHPGEVVLRAPAEQTFTSAAGNPDVARAIDPIAGGGNACASTAADDEPGTVNLRSAKVGGEGFTLMGSPTVVADLRVTGSFAQVVGRLWDVGPDGRQTLVARTVYRPDASGRQVFQLHPNGWRFAPGHVAKLQLLGRDAPYARPSNGAFSVAVRDLEVRLPVAETPGKGPVTKPLPLPLPKGATLAPGFGPSEPVTRSGRRPARRRARPRLRLKVGCRRVRLAGRDVKRVRRVRFGRTGMKHRVDRRRPFTVRHHGRGKRVRAVVRMKGGRRVVLRKRVPKRCR